MLCKRKQFQFSKQIPIFILARATSLIGAKNIFLSENLSLKTFWQSAREKSQYQALGQLNLQKDIKPFKRLLPYTLCISTSNPDQHKLDGEGVGIYYLLSYFTF